MPRSNVPRDSEPNAIYHVYNRGVNKQTTFEDADDFHFFNLILGDLLNSRPPSWGYHRRTFGETVEVHAYCLMNNHYHLICRQKGENDLSEFMKSLSTTYTMRFNKRHQRVGTLFDGPFRARKVRSQDDLVNLSKYVHRNPIEAGFDIENYQFSSLRQYLGKESRRWLTTNLVLANTTRSDYAEFVRAA